MAYITLKEMKAIAKSNAQEIKRLTQRNKAYTKDDYVTNMKNEDNVVEFDNLHTYFYTENGVVKAVNGVSFDIPKNNIVGIVGESGCGKSVTSLSLMRLVQGPMGQIVEGSIRFKTVVDSTDEKGHKIPVFQTIQDENGNESLKLDAKGHPIILKDKNGFFVYEQEEKTFDIAKMPLKEMYQIRGKDMTMIFQEPMTSLNPVFTIGNQLDEVSFLHNHADKTSAKAKSVEMLSLVGIPDPEQVYNRYPHELSGGMRQRVMIAMALAANPKLIIADEPTTALDVTIQAQILDLLRTIKSKSGSSIMLITHDLGVIAEMADYVIVMYAGRIIEKGTALEIFENPIHPYTVGLQKSKPRVDGNSNEPLFSIPGNVPNPVDMPSYCYFKNRCDKCNKKCEGPYPEMVQVSPTHFVSCYLAQEKGGK